MDKLHNTAMSGKATMVAKTAPLGMPNFSGSSLMFNTEGLTPVKLFLIVIGAHSDPKTSFFADLPISFKV